MLGSSSAEVAVRTTIRKAGKSLEDWAGEVLELAQATSGEQPEMQESLRRRSGADVDAMHNEAFAFGLDSLLDGLEVGLKK